MAGSERDWRGDLERWLDPFLRALKHPARRALCPAYVAELIGLGDRKSIQPMAARTEGIGYDRLHHFIGAAGSQASRHMSTIEQQLRGKWRITETSTWDNAYLDLVEPAFILDKAGSSEFRFGVVVASLDCSYSQTDVGFEWDGFDEGTEVRGDGWAETDGPDAIQGEITFHNGDDTTFKAHRW